MEIRDQQQISSPGILKRSSSSFSRSPSQRKTIIKTGDKKAQATTFTKGFYLSLHPSSNGIQIPVKRKPPNPNQRTVNQLRKSLTKRESSMNNLISSPSSRVTVPKIKTHITSLRIRTDQSDEMDTHLMQSNTERPGPRFPSVRNSNTTKIQRFDGMLLSVHEKIGPKSNNSCQQMLKWNHSKKMKCYSIASAYFNGSGN